MRNIIFGGIVLLLILHQDFWWWDAAEPYLFGFIPIGLAYHAGVSVCAAFLWYLATIFCWPEDVEIEVAEARADTADSSSEVTP